MSRISNAKYKRWLTEEGLERIRGWVREGLSPAKLAVRMNISLATLTEWRKTFPAIEKALQQDPELLNMQAENALLQRALGCEYTEERTEESEKNGVKTVRIVKHIPPDTKALSLWLRNRCSDRWGNPSVPRQNKLVNPCANMSIEELRKLAYNDE